MERQQSLLTEAGSWRRKEGSPLDLISRRCLLEIQMEMSSRHVNYVSLGLKDGTEIRDEDIHLEAICI